MDESGIIDPDPNDLHPYSGLQELCLQDPSFGRSGGKASAVVMDPEPDEAPDPLQSAAASDAYSSLIVEDQGDESEEDAEEEAASWHDDEARQKTLFLQQ